MRCNCRANAKYITASINLTSKGQVCGEETLGMSEPSPPPLYTHSQLRQRPVFNLC